MLKLIISKPYIFASALLVCLVWESGAVGGVAAQTRRNLDNRCLNLDAHDLP